MTHISFDHQKPINYIKLKFCNKKKRKKKNCHVQFNLKDADFINQKEKKLTLNSYNVSYR